MSLHYPTEKCPVETDKPVFIGEMGSMFYSTPTIFAIWSVEGLSVLGRQN